MTFDSKIENNLLNELNTFFNGIDKSNFYQNEQYDKLLEIINRNHKIINDQTKTIAVYNSVSTDNFSDWQEDIYIDIQSRLTGICPHLKKINL